MRLPHALTCIVTASLTRSLSHSRNTSNANPKPVSKLRLNHKSRRLQDALRTFPLSRVCLQIRCPSFFTFFSIVLMLITVLCLTEACHKVGLKPMVHLNMAVRPDSVIVMSATLALSTSLCCTHRERFLLSTDQRSSWSTTSGATLCSVTSGISSHVWLPSTGTALALPAMLYGSA